MQTVYDEQLRAADLQQVTYTDFVAGLLRAQGRDRQENALEWRILRAMLPERWLLETFPYAKQPGVNRKQIRAFAELDFVAKRENLVFIGPTGVGKTGPVDEGFFAGEVVLAHDHALLVSPALVDLAVTAVAVPAGVTGVVLLPE
jgi:IstB-like ATP binding protein